LKEDEGRSKTHFRSAPDTAIRPGKKTVWRRRIDAVPRRFMRRFAGHRAASQRARARRSADDVGGKRDEKRARAEMPEGADPGRWTD